jgi:hypothetical protein
MTGSPRRAAVLVALVLAAGLTGCGQGSGGGPHAATTPSATESGSSSGGRPWVVRLDALSGEDGETKQATYLAVVPSTGEVSAVRMPALQIGEASGVQRVVLVDAANRWALADSRPSRADRARGQVTLVGLPSGRRKTVDVRRATGSAQLTPDWVAFDAERPGLLRVVDGLTVWTLTVDGTQARKEGVLPRRPGWIFGGGFNKNTGTPYIEDTGSFDTLPKGNGDLDVRPVRRAGGRLLLTENGRYAGLPDPKCQLSTGFRYDDGEAWVFCVEGRHLQVRRLAAGDSAWEDYGRPTRDVVPSGAEPTFTLPPTDAD